MKSRNAKWLLAFYPRTWRERYGQELLAVIESAAAKNGRIGRRATFDVIGAGIEQRLRSSGLWGNTVPPSERRKAGLLLVLCSWSLFVVAGIGLQKVSEHWQSATPLADRPIPQAAFDAIFVGAVLGSIAVVTGVLLVIRHVAPLRRSDAWRPIRRSIIRATASTLLTCTVLAGVVVWAHQLSGVQRNGGDPLYGAAVVGLAVCVLATVAAWTAAAVTAAGRISLSQTMVHFEAALAAFVTLVMAVVTAAATIWWVSVSDVLPSSFATMLTLVLAMLVATCLASAGTLRAMGGALGPT